MPDNETWAVTSEVQKLKEKIDANIQARIGNFKDSTLGGKFTCLSDNLSYGGVLTHLMFNSKLLEAIDRTIGLLSDLYKQNSNPNAADVWLVCQDLNQKIQIFKNKVMPESGGVPGQRYESPIASTNSVVDLYKGMAPHVVEWIKQQGDANYDSGTDSTASISTI
jgi:hypothetical protein